MLDLFIKLVLAYLTGCIMGSQLLGHLHGVDIRNAGSGNAGGTNALRTQGKWFALGVVVIDIGKGVVAAGLIPALALFSNEPSPLWLASACAAAAVIGHVFPAFYGFRGGKGAATMVGTLLVLAPIIVVPLLIVWLLSIALTGYVGLASMISAEISWLLTSVVFFDSRMDLVIYTGVISLFVVFTHRANIRRMLDGTEPRNERLMLWRK